jgi:hypothetical protein
MAAGLWGHVIGGCGAELVTVSKIGLDGQYLDCFSINSIFF